MYVNATYVLSALSFGGIISASKWNQHSRYLPACRRRLLRLYAHDSATRRNFATNRNTHTHSNMQIYQCKFNNHRCNNHSAVMRAKPAMRQFAQLQRRSNAVWRAVMCV